MSNIREMNRVLVICRTLYVRFCFVLTYSIFADGRQSIRLKQVQVPYIDHSTCSSGAWYGNAVHESMLCAGYNAGGKDSCQVINTN